MVGANCKAAVGADLSAKSAPLSTAVALGGPWRCLGTLVLSITILSFDKERHQKDVLFQKSQFNEQIAQTDSQMATIVIDFKENICFP